MQGLSRSTPASGENATSYKTFESFVPSLRASVDDLHLLQQMLWTAAAPAGIFICGVVGSPGGLRNESPPSLGSTGDWGEDLLGLWPGVEVLQQLK